MEMIDSYRRLTVGQYEEIQAVDKRTDLEDLDKQVKILSVLSGRPEGDILRLPIPEYREAVRRSRFLEVSALDKAGLRPAIAKSYRLGDLVLIPVTDFRKVTTAQYVDFQTFAPVVDDQPAALLSVLMVPKGKGYNEGYDIGDVQRAIREHLTLADAAAVIAFFLLSSRTSIEASLNSLERLARKTKDRTMQDRLTKIRTLFPGSGAGSPASTQ